MTLSTRLAARFLAFVTARRAGAHDVSRPVLYAVYGSDIAVRLKRIHAHPERDGVKGTLVVALHGRKSAQVSCSFRDGGQMLICEVIPGAPVSAETESALQSVGYWRDEASGRFVFAYEVTRDSCIWGGAAAVILEPLIDVFGARPESKIDIVAPLAPNRDEAAIRQEKLRGL